jgi:hypothetical protein
MTESGQPWPNQDAPHQPYPHPYPTPAFAPPPPPEPPRKSGAKWAVSIVAGVLVLIVAIVVGLWAADSKEVPQGEVVAGGDVVQLSMQDLDALATAREKALNAQDLQGFLAPLDKGNPKLVESQTRLFENLHKVPFAVRRYEPFDQAGRAVDRFGRGVSVKLDVAFAHQIDGFDVAPVTEWYRWTVTRKDATSPPVITDVTGAPGTGSASKTVYYPAPWDAYPDMQVVRTDRTLFLSDGANLPASRKYAPVAEAAAQRVVGAWQAQGRPDRVVDRFVVTIVKDKSALASLYQMSEEKPTEEGHSIPMLVAQRGSNAIGGARVVVDGTSGLLSRDGGDELFRHEFAHSLIANKYRANPDDGLWGKENWVAEGFAEYVANRESGTAGPRLASAMRAVRSGAVTIDRLPTNDSWNSGDVSFQYYLGHQAMRYIKQQYGEAKVFAFVLAVYDGGTPDSAARAVLGVDLDSFEAGWRTFTRAETR